MSADSEIRVLTLNCWGIPYWMTKDCNYRLSCIADELSKGLHDIVALQEIWTVQHFEEIKKTVASVLPYSHYFHSGVIGTGLCVFSKYPILDAFLHQFSANGHFYAITHADWFAGKGIGYCVIKHPDQDIHLFNLHLHASYPSNLYTELRTLQAYQCGQFISKLTRPDDTVILCGDFNLEDTEIGLKSIKMLTGLRDSWRSTANKPPEPYNTCNTADNPYASKVEGMKRLDFIFHNSRLKCIENGLDCEQIPGSNCHFSDHKGVKAKFQLQDRKIEAATDLQESRETIFRELQDTIAYGLKCAEEYKWKWIIPIWILLSVFIFMPVFSGDGVYFMIPVLNCMSGGIVFLIQTLCVIGSVSYFWALVILKRMEQAAYKNALLEIQLKIDSKQHL